MSEGRSYTIHVSGVPPGINTPLHHMERHRLWTGYRNEVGWQARALVNQAGSHAPFVRAHVRCIVLAKNPRHFFDHDNVHSVVKPLVDALKGILIVDDSPRHIELSVAQQLGDRRGVVVEVTEIVDEQAPVPPTHGG